MEIKILQVFYGKDGLPYKDKDRQVHFPITGTGFLGASNTTKIKFYYDELDNLDETTWVAVSKLPNGKVGSRVLESYLDEELNEHYALLELDNYYTQYKGDVFISLQGYQGGVDFDYDEENSQYEIHGTPTIAATGSIKFAINYANQFVGSDETDNINFQRILAALGTKLGMRAYSEHVEELPSEGSPDVFYVVNDDPNDPNLANIYVWNENTRHYIWVGDNTLNLGEYYTKEQGEQFESGIDNRVANVENELSSVASGSPAGVYATLSDLTTADPNHSKIYLVLADNNWYYWDGTIWTSGGEYLSGNLIPIARTGLSFISLIKENNPAVNKGLYIITDSSASCFIKGNIYEIDSSNHVTLFQKNYELELNSNLCNLTNVANGYINDTGGVTANASFYHTDYIEVEPNKVYKRYNYLYTYYAYYDENFNFVAGYSTLGNVGVKMTVPNNNSIKYVRITLTSGSQTCSVNKLLAGPQCTEYKIKKVQDTIEQNTKTNLYDTNEKYSNVYVRGDYDSGATANGSNFYSFITKVKENVKYYYYGVFPGYYIFLDENYSVISAHGNDYSLTQGFIVPTNARYGCFTINGSFVDKDKVWLRESIWQPPKKQEIELIQPNKNNNPCDYDGNEICVFKKGIAIGDSTTLGVFNVNSPSASYQVYTEYSYPTYLQKITGIPIVNAGDSSKTVETWWSAHQNDDFSGYDFAIISLGINNYGNYDATTFAAAFGNIINALKTANNNIKIFITTITPVYSWGNSNYDTINDAIRTIVSNNANCYLVDLSVYGKAQKGTPYENGHGSALGYLQTAKDIKAYISYIIVNDLSAFRNVQFIGTNYSY